MWVCACVCVLEMIRLLPLCHFWANLLLVALSYGDRKGLWNFNTEFWNSLIMQIYANSFKKNPKCYFHNLQWIFILFVLSDKAWWELSNIYTEFRNFINYVNLCKFFFKIHEKCYFNISQWILILFYMIGLGRGFEIFTQNSEIH